MVNTHFKIMYLLSMSLGRSLQQEVSIEAKVEEEQGLEVEIV